MKLESMYRCSCGKEHRVKAILAAKMNYCYSCGKEIDKNIIENILEKYIAAKKNK